MREVILLVFAVTIVEQVLRPFDLYFRKIE